MFYVKTRPTNQMIRNFRMAREHQDREFAEMLQAKEKAKLKRAKDRAKLKKLQRQHQDDEEADNHQANSFEQSARTNSFEQTGHHERANSQPVSLNVSAGQLNAARAESRQSRRSDGGGGVLPNGRHSRTSANSRSFEEDVRPPARRPYMNPGAIDLHRSEFAVHPTEVVADDEEDEEDDNFDENDVQKELEEPQ